jgi:hypothetical protein
MSPIRILLFLAAILSLLLLLSLVFPESGIPLTGKHALQFPTLAELFAEKKKNQYVDKLFSDSATADPAKALITAPKTKIEFVIDTTNPARLHYPNNDKSVLYPLFEWLDSAQHGGNFRLLHYGDSQLEEDRMTNVIREELQRRFGGSGTGMMAVVPVAVSMSLRQSWSGNWTRFVSFGDYWAQADHNRYGAMSGLSTYSGSDAWVKFSTSPELALDKKNASKIERLIIIVGNVRSACQVQITADDSLYEKKSLTIQKDVQFVRVEFPAPVSEVRVKFSGQSPEVYGITLDGKSGVSVDNLAIRGSSGLEFSKMNRDLLAAIYKELHVKFAILQFGGNFAPVCDSQKDIDWYSTSYRKQLGVMRSLGIPFIHIGMADMSVRRRAQMVTSPGVEPTRDLLKKAVLDSGGVYWDMYEAMGGENSMPDWVAAKLAIDDYIHFNRQGAEKIAKLFIQNLMQDYREYRMRMDLKTIGGTE